MNVGARIEAALDARSRDRGNVPSYFGRRQTHAAGRSWSKWGAPLELKPWWAFKAGMAGLALTFACLGALAALLVPR